MASVDLEIMKSPRVGGQFLGSSPVKALRVAVVRTWRGEGHAVLTVSTDHGDYVLDNREWEILPWTEAKYVWISRQDAENPMAWVALQRARPLIATATRSGGDTNAK